MTNLGALGANDADDPQALPNRRAMIGSPCDSVVAGVDDSWIWTLPRDSAAEDDVNVQCPIPRISNTQGSDKDRALTPPGYWIFVGLGIGY